MEAPDGVDMKTPPFLYQYSKKGEDCQTKPWERTVRNTFAVFLTFFTFVSLTGRGGVGYNGTRENEVMCLDAFKEMLLEELGTPTAFTIPLLGGIKVSQSVVVSWIVMAVLILVSVCLTRNLKVENPGKVQVALESAVEFLNGFVKTNIGEHWRPFAPWLGTVALYIGFANIIGNDSIQWYLDLIRGYGTRIMNAEKNTGKAQYMFNALQDKFLPDLLKAPRYNRGHGIT